MKNHHKVRRIVLLVSLIIISVLAILYFQRKKIVSRYVPEVTRFYAADLTLKNDSLTGTIALGLRNKSETLINIDSIAASLRLDTITFLDLKQNVGIYMQALTEDTLFLRISIPVVRFIDFVESVENKDSIQMFYSLDIFYNTELGEIKLPVKDSINIVAPRKVQGEVLKFEYEKYRDKTVYANLLMYIYNPGRLNLTVQDIHYHVNTDGDISSDGVYEKDVTLNPGEETIFTLPVQIKVEKPLKTVLNVISDNDTYNYSLTLDGKLKTKDEIFNGCLVILHHNGEFEVFNKDVLDETKK